MITLESSTSLKEITVQADGQEVILMAGSADYRDQVAAYRYARESGVFLDVDQRDPVVEALALDRFMRMRQIREWKGVALSDGTDAPCTDMNKMWFFAKYPEALEQYLREMADQEAADSKN